MFYLDVKKKSKASFSVLTISALSLGNAIAASPIAVDNSFGVDGIAAPAFVDVAHSAYWDPTIARLAHLQLAGGYALLTEQQVGASPKLVITRYTEDGQIEVGFGTAGSRALNLPTPIGNATMVAGTGVGVDALYVAATYFTGGTTYLYVARLDASGSFDPTFGGTGFEMTALRSSFAASVGSILAASANIRMEDGSEGLLLAVCGSGADAHKIFLVQADNTGIVEPPTAIAVDSVNQISARADGHAEVVGTQGGNATYHDFDAENSTFPSKFDYSFECEGTPAAQSVADAMTRGSPMDDDILVAGRAICMGDHQPRSAVARINMPSGSLKKLVWSNAYEQSTPACLDINERCPASIAASSKSPEAVMLTVNAHIARIGIDNGDYRGADDTESTGSFAIAPSAWEGFSFNYPIIVGTARTTTPTISIGALNIDRIFASGMGN